MSDPAGPTPTVVRHGARTRTGRALELGIALYGGVVFAVLWLGLAVGVGTGGGPLEDAWTWLTGLESVAAFVTWVLILPIGIGLWAWNEAGSSAVLAVVALGLMGWTILAAQGLWKTLGRR